MQRGGKREGAGRPPGSPNRISLDKSKYLERIDSGQQTLPEKLLDPLEFMLSVVSDPDAPLGLRLQAARDSARYIYPTLQSVDVTARNAPMSHEEALAYFADALEPTSQEATPATSEPLPVPTPKPTVAPAEVYEEPKPLSREEFLELCSDYADPM